MHDEGLDMLEDGDTNGSRLFPVGGIVEITRM